MRWGRWVAVGVVLVAAALWMRGQVPTERGAREPGPSTTAAGLRVDVSGAPAVEVPEQAERVQAEKPAEQGILSGRVVDTQGAHVEAEVILRRYLDPLGPAVRVRTDTQGAFSLVLETGHWTAHAEADGRVSEPKEARVLHTRAEEVEFAIREAVVVTGVATDEHGVAAEGARVVGFTVGRPGNATKTDSMGRYQVQMCRARYTTLLVAADGYPVVSCSLDFGKAKAVRRDFQLHRGVRVTGQVLDRFGSPLPDARVWGWVENDLACMCLQRAEVEADSQGRFVIEGMSPTDWMLSAHAYGHLCDVRVIDVRQSREVEFRLCRETGVSGRIVPAPVLPSHVRNRPFPAGMELVVRKGGRSSYPSPVLGQLLDSGEFFMNGMQPGRYVVRAEFDGYEPAESREFELIDGGMVEGIEIRLVPGATIRGVVRSTRTGDPVPDAWIRARQGDAREDTETATTDKSGRYEVSGLLAGNVRLVADADGRQTQVVSMHIERGAEYVFDFVLEAGLTLTGKFLVDGRPPVGQVYLYVTSSDWTRYGAMMEVSPEGSFQAGGLEPGGWVLRTDRCDVAGDWQGRQFPIRIDAGVVPPLTVEIRSLPRLTGTARCGGKPLVKKTVYFYQEGSQAVVSCETDGKGRFAIGGIEGGEWRVTTQDPGASRSAGGAAPDAGLTIQVPFGATETRVDLDLP